MEKNNCPCQSGKAYGQCCASILERPGSAPDPEALMRSRYTAFCRKDSRYLIRTLAPAKRVGNERFLHQELARTMERTTWVGLRVLKSALEGKDRGGVEFSAFFNQDGQFGQLHEHSFFVREKGMWFYLDGKILPPVTIGRNQPCICGSGLKFKRCHGR